MHRFLTDANFCNLMRRHIYETIDLLLQKGEFFSVLTHINSVNFDPQLPEEISRRFKPVTLFDIAEYTFESATIDDKNFYFEAGFGAENIGSFVTVPLSSIVQILLGDTPILINLSIEVASQEEHHKDGIERSTNIFLSNPKNKKILKK